MSDFAVWAAVIVVVSAICAARCGWKPRSINSGWKLVIEPPTPIATHRIEAAITQKR